MLGILLNQFWSPFKTSHLRNEYKLSILARVAFYMEYMSVFIALEKCKLLFS